MFWYVKSRPEIGSKNFTQGSTFAQRGTAIVHRMLLLITLLFLFCATAIAQKTDCDGCTTLRSTPATTVASHGNGIPSQPPFRVTSKLWQLKPQRILIVTMLDRQDRLREQQTLSRNLAEHLRLKTNFDVVEASERVCMESYPLRAGRFNERRLVELGIKYQVDSILYCNVESIDAYHPMRIEIQFVLVHASESIAVASGRRRFSLSDSAVKQAYLRSIDCNGPAPATFMSSPTRLIEFSAAQLAGDLTKLWR